MFDAIRLVMLASVSPGRLRDWRQLNRGPLSRSRSGLANVRTERLLTVRFWGRPFGNFCQEQMFAVVDLSDRVWSKTAN
jgi:hypothetical protein